jgi:hypothetical protein
VDIRANGGVLVPNATYGNFTAGYVNVPASTYVIDVNAAGTSTTVASYVADLSTLGGGAAVVFASGFLNPAQNLNGAAFGLFAALPSGTVIQLPAVGAARAQVIHNAADPGAATVDVYVNVLNDTIKIDNFAFRAATPFLTLPAGYPITIGVAPASSSSIADALATFPATLVNGESYTIVANGVLNPASFAANPNGVSTAFTLLIAANAQETGTGNNVDVRVLHGSTDAPTVGAAANGGLAVPAATYKDFSGYLSIPAAAYRIDVTAPNNASTVIAPFFLDASALNGKSALIFASGFLDPAANQNGPAFGLFAALADGTVAPLTPVSTARAQVIHNAADPAADTVDVYVNVLSDTIKIDNFAFRTATPFLTLPSGYPITIGVALPNSSSIADAIATFPATLMAGESYSIVANGVLNPANFAANPGGTSTAFGLLISAGAREAGTGSNLDIKILHGATDAPAVGAAANGALVVPTASYTNFTGYLSIPAAEYVIDVTAPNNAATVVAPFYLNATALNGQAALVFASGFLTPSANQNGPAFGLFAALPSGAVAALTPVGGARAQVIHNAADPAAEVVDIYVNTLKDTIKIEDFTFRTATGFLGLPAGYPIRIAVAPGTSTSIANALATIPLTLDANESYHVVANGVLTPSSFAANPNGTSTAFGLFTAAQARETATVAANTSLRVFHGATDAPNVDVRATVVPTPLVADLEYTEFNGHFEVPAASYTLQITPAGTPGTVVAAFTADLTTLGGGAGIVLASGFLNPAANQNGDGFGLLLVLPNGTATLLPLATRLDLPLNANLARVFPNPSNGNATLRLSVEQPAEISWQLLDLQGRTVLSDVRTLGAGTEEISLPMQSLAPGFYQLSVNDGRSRAVIRVSVVR